VYRFTVIGDRSTRKGNAERASMIHVMVMARYIPVMQLPQSSTETFARKTLLARQMMLPIKQFSFPPAGLALLSNGDDMQGSQK
jgi:hypothetical protein